MDARSLTPTKTHVGVRVSFIVGVRVSVRVRVRVRVRVSVRVSFRVTSRDRVTVAVMARNLPHSEYPRTRAGSPSPDHPNPNSLAPDPHKSLNRETPKSISL